MKWISVKKKLPEAKVGVHAKTYFVASKTWEEIGTAKYSKERGWHRKSNGMAALVVSHWADPYPIPLTAPMTFR